MVLNGLVLKVLLVNGSWSDGSRFAAARFLASAAVHVLRDYSILCLPRGNLTAS